MTLTRETNLKRLKRRNLSEIPISIIRDSKAEKRGAGDSRDNKRS
jgi:hypothetical protein